MTAALLTVAVGWATWRTRRFGWRQSIVWLQIPAAVLLYTTLYPPLRPLRSDALTVLTEDATSQLQGAAPGDQLQVALPEASAPTDVEGFPDLATALRKYPAVRNLTILGAGLGARDRPPSVALTRFDRAPQRGIIELQAPAAVLLGHEFLLRGRTAPGIQRVELHDPSGAIADQSHVSPTGDFALSAIARGEGSLRFEIQAFDASGAPVDTVSAPFVVHGGQAISAVMRAGAVNAEVKYWRRWAADAGMQLQFSAALTQGVAARSKDGGLTPAILAQTDFAILDSRAWTGLDASEKSALYTAVHDGLGLLLRVDGPIDAATAADWQRFGITLDTAKIRKVSIDQRSGLHGRAAFAAAPARLPAQANELLAADDGEVLASWRSFGKGRAGIWLLLDSYQLVLLGEGERYASLWSDVVNTLSRAHGHEASAPYLPQHAWVDERAVFCELGEAANVAAPDGVPVTLLRDESRCAAYWPAVAGWHTLRTAGAQWPFYVRGSDDGRGLRNARDGAATAGLIGPPDAASSASALQRPRARWPFFLGWLLLSAEIWRQERKRAAWHDA